MRWCWLVFLVLWWEGGVGADPRPGLTVRTVRTPVEEEGSSWVREYFVDVEGRIQRVRTTVGGPDPRVWEVAVEVVDGGVAWKRDDGLRRVTVGPEGLTLVVEPTSGAAGPAPRLCRWNEDGSLGWVDGDQILTWDPSTGLQSRGPGPAGDPPDDGITTRGSRISRWRQGHEVERILWSRSPSSLTGTWVESNLNLTGWDTVGTSVLSGPGLWAEDRSIRWLNWLILEDLDDLPLAAPLVLVPRYLK